MSDRIRIKFELENEDGAEYTQESYIKVYYDLGERDYDLIGDQLNIFLKLAGYIRHNDHIFMEDVTSNELVALEEFLTEYRGRANKCISD